MNLISLAASIHVNKVKTPLHPDKYKENQLSHEKLNSESEIQIQRIAITSNRCKNHEIS